MTTRDEKLDDAQKVLDFLRDNPSLEVPDFDWLTVYDWAPDASRVRAVARTLRTFDKRFSANDVALVKSFGSARLRYVFNRSGVCEMKQVGTKKEKVQKVANYIEVEEEVPIYEYDCPALLIEEKDLEQ